MSQNRPFPRLFSLVLIVWMCSTPVDAAAKPALESFETLGRSFQTRVRPLLVQCCGGCHSTKKKEGELDLERFGKLAGGRVLDYQGKSHRQMCSLLLSLMDKFDIHLDRFGDSATRLAEV